MEYRNVGASGLKVSEIAVGSWMTDLAGSEKARIAEETIRLAYDQGVNFLTVQMPTVVVKRKSFWDAF